MSRKRYISPIRGKLPVKKNLPNFACWDICRTYAKFYVNELRGLVYTGGQILFSSSEMAGHPNCIKRQTSKRPIVALTSKLNYYFKDRR